MPWMVSYLREDIQDLGNEVREVRRSVQRLDEKLDSGLERLDAKIDAKIGGLDAKIGDKIEGLDAKMDAKIERLRQDMDVRFRWVLTTMVAVGALIVAALKFLP